MAEKKKKKLIRVKKWKKDEENRYGYQKAQFAWMSPPIEGVRTQITPFVYCRERVAAYVHAAMNNQDYNSDWHNSDPSLFDKENVRILIARDPSDFETFRDKLFNAKAVMNIYEDIAGWDRSKITTVKHEVHPNVWLLTGPGGWLMSPQMISAFTFILRTISEYGPINVDDGIKSVEAEFERLYKKYKDRDGHADITRYLKFFRYQLYILMKYHKEIFGKTDRSKLWPKSINSGTVGSVGGLLTFTPTHGVSNDYYWKSWKKTFTKLCKKHLKKQY